MYQINGKQNRIIQLEEKTFSELGFKERENLQEWIAYNPSVFGEDLLIIQKEFSNFSGTKERLDLLALDKVGNLVIVENKLDDSGKDVTWQSLKYASYCSELSTANIKKMYQDYLDRIFGNGKQSAESNLIDFFDEKEYDDIVLNNGFSQRVILVASEFRKEVTSTVLWLMNYKLDIKCFKTSLSILEDKTFINFEQIIPTKDAEDYMIGMADKAQEEIQTKSHIKKRNIVLHNFWVYLLDRMNKKSTLFESISPSKESWLGKGSGMRGVPYHFAVSKSYSRVEVYIDRGNKDENKKVFDLLFSDKNEIEEIFGEELEWERLDDGQGCRIKLEQDGNVSEEDQWESMSEFMVNSMINMEKSFKKFIAKANASLKNSM